MFRNAAALRVWTRQAVVHPPIWLTGALCSFVALTATLLIVLLTGLELPTWLAFASAHTVLVFAYLWGWLVSRQAARRGGAELVYTPLKRTHPLT